MNYLAVGFGGMAGSVIRYAISLYTINLRFGPLPYGTLIANMFGCLCLGLLTGLNQDKQIIPKKIMLGVGTGMIGSMTTFSTFSIETLRLYEHYSVYMAAMYVIISAVLGLILAGVGFYMGFGFGESGDEK